MAINVMECDLVVLGTGAAGPVAAVKAADDSGKKVIILEKGKKPGGGGTFGHVFPIKDSKWQKEAGETVNDPPDVSGQFFDWLVTKGGAEEYWKVTGKPGDRSAAVFGTLAMYKRLDKYKDHPDPSIGPGWTGTYVFEKMLECCKKIGIPVITGARAKKFITDAKGRLTGVVADTDDGELQVNCKACFMGMGGFGSDYEKCRKLWPDDFNYKPMARLSPPDNTGDWIEMAQGIGAAVDLKSANLELFGMIHHPYSYSIYSMLLNKMIMTPRPEWLLVTLNGDRWSYPADYTGGPGGKKDKRGLDVKKGPNPLSSLPGGAVYAIADSHTMEILGNKAIADDWDVWAVPILNRWREEVEYEAALDEKKTSHGNHVKKADTLEDLALKMDVDPKAFVATVERYNKHCDNRKDPDFGKDPAALIPVRTPPYYAIWAHRFQNDTMGGMLVNDNMEVLDTKGKAIPGLFAGGSCTTSTGAAGMRRGWTAGFVGGISAAKYLQSLG